MDEMHLRVLSLNCWGLKYVSKCRTQRMRAIATELVNMGYDVIGLQELWVFSDFEFIRAQVRKRLPYAKFFYSGALGAGLAIFSRFPIIGSSIHPYSLNGSPVDVITGDWFVGKAAASVMITHPILGMVEIFNTHLFAKGGEDGPEHNRAHRLVNALEFAKLVRMSADMGRYVIATGDFNSIPTALPMTVIREYAGLKDAWAASHGVTSYPLATEASPEDAIDLFGVTADSPLNSFSAGKVLDVQARKCQGKRLDYIFYRQSTIFDESKPTLHCTSSSVVFKGKIPGSNVSFSDHFGLEATLNISINCREDQDDGTHPSQQQTHLTHLSRDSIATVLQALIACYRTSRARSRLQLVTFVGCIALLILATVGSAWLPTSRINPIFILSIVFVAWLATTMLYVGFIHGNWELRALTNVIEELELLRNHWYRQRESDGEIR